MTSQAPPKGPILFDLEETSESRGPASPAEAAPVPDPIGGAGSAVTGVHDPQGKVAMDSAMALAARRPSWLARLFWSALMALLGMVVSLAAWDFVTGLLARNPTLGWIASGLAGVLVLVLLVVALRELAALSRLSRIDGLRQAAALVSDLAQARALTDRVVALYRGRADMRWSRERFIEARENVFDASAEVRLAETHLLAGLDAAATREVEAAARQVATVTAFVPIALADVVVALAANLRMIRRIAVIYGGRGGTFGAWRLTRAVMAHLVATGAVAVGDDLVGSVAGGGALAKVSRRFGEGVINGALTARVGVAAMEVCRPLPFGVAKPPSVTGILKRGVTGLFSQGTSSGVSQ